MKIRWPRLTFPPINLWTAPHQPALEDTMTATAERDDVECMLCARIDELERDKEVLAAQLDRAEEELAEAKRAQAIMRDTFATQVQQAVSRARRDWAAQGSPWVKAQWQAEALDEAAMDIRANFGHHAQYSVSLLTCAIDGMADAYRRQSEGGE